MLLNLIVIICIVCFIYVLVNGVTTIYLRIYNPLKKITQNNKKIYLTFDDGIDKRYTPAILNLLNKYNVRATFFVLTQTIEQNELVLKEMKKDNHLIGFHGFKHDNLIIKDPFLTKKNFDKSIEILKKYGINPKFYRPTWGHINLLGLYYCKKHNLKIMLWNVIVQDWQADTSSEIICDKLIKKVHGNSIICLHDGRGKNNAPKKTIDALNIMIPRWIKEGYSFETVDKLD